MATTTPNFGWPVPTSTDLVKDGATAIEGLGDAIDASLLDLKGGTTGQVLAKASGTDMDFSWVAQDDSNAIQNAIVDAKGDLIAASANDTPARLAVGANGETLVADSSTSTGLRYQATQAAGKNAIINGGFDIWQRGTSFGSLTDGGFFADRWAVDFNGTGATRTVSRQEIAGAWATSSRYFMRYAQSVAGTGGTYNWFHTRIEGVATYAGQTVTVSFMAKADASRSVDVAISQVFGGGGSSQVNYNFGTAALTTSWQRFTYNVALTSISGKTIGTNDNLELDFKMPLNTAMTIDVGDIQLEVGSVATQFTRTGGTIQGELAACQRYYYRVLSDATGNPLSNTGGTVTTTIGQVYLLFPVTMRANISAFDFSGIQWYNFANNTLYDTGTFTLSGGTTNLGSVRYTHGSAIFTAGEVGAFTSGSSTSYIGFSAELQEMTMDNVTFFTDELDGKVHAIINRGNGEFTAMLKSTYDAMQAEQSTPSVIDEAEAK